MGYSWEVLLSGPVSEKQLTNKVYAVPHLANIMETKEIKVYAVTYLANIMETKEINVYAVTYLANIVETKEINFRGREKAENEKKFDDPNNK